DRARLPAEGDRRRGVRLPAAARARREDGGWRQPLSGARGAPARAAPRPARGRDPPDRPGATREEGAECGCRPRSAATRPQGRWRRRDPDAGADRRREGALHGGRDLGRVPGSLRGVPGPGMALSGRPLRLLVAKPGLDGHDRGAKVIARALRDAGFEVIYTGLHQPPAMIAEAAIQEDVDAVGLSVLSGAHLTLFPAVLDELRQRGGGDIPVFGGGIIPDEDVPALSAAGVRRVFTPGASIDDIV